MMQSRKVSLTKRQGARYGIAFGLLWLLLLPTVFQIARVNAAITNSWISTTALPIAISGSGALATSNNVYSMGGDFQDRTGIGCPCGATVQVFFAPRLSDGSLGPWTTTTPLPDFRAHFTPLLADGMVYAIGGHRLDGIAQGSSTSFVAPLLSDGSIGSWSTTTSLPMTDFSYGATVFNGRIYVVGGSNGFGPRSEVLFSTVNADGSLGGWTFTTPLPIASEHLVVFTFNDRLYALAGSRTGTTTMMAPINTDGSLGAWQTATPLPLSFVSGLARGLLVGNRVFLLGLQQLSSGQTQLSALTTTIDSDGTLAPWEFDTLFPSPLFSFGFVGDQQALYVIGGGVFGGANRIDSVFFTSPQSQKQPSTISAFVSRDSIPLGQGISVFGSISPAHAAQVTLTYTKPDGTTLTRTTDSLSNGGYADSFTSDLAGHWSVRALWLGDSDHLGATSGLAEFIVNSLDVSVTIARVKSSVCDKSINPQLSAKVTIGDNPQRVASPVFGMDIFPETTSSPWSFTLPVSSLPVIVQIEAWGSGVQQCDINPDQNTKSLNMVFDLNTQILSGVGVICNQDQGCGYSSGDDSTSAAIWFGVSSGSTTDTDGDGILNTWEKFGLPGSPLPSLGSRVDQKDVFVQVDWMECNQSDLSNPTTGCSSVHSHKPTNEAMNLIATSFQQRGIALHVVFGNAVPHRANMGTCINLGPLGSKALVDWEGFFDIKHSSFDDRRLPVFHYALFADSLPCGFSGFSDGIPGNDLIVALGDALSGNDLFSINFQAGTFMHELGHNLGLGHGGQDHTNYKPNYLSVMNYFFQFQGIRLSSTNQFTLCSTTDSCKFDYSSAALPVLNEDDLNENIGVQDSIPHLAHWYYVVVRSGSSSGPIDWNANGEAHDVGLKIDLNGDGFLGAKALQGYSDWDRLIFNFRRYGSVSDGVHDFFIFGGKLDSEATLLQLRLISDGVSAEPPGEVIQSVISMLTAIGSSDEHVIHAIKELQASLDTPLWVDSFHLKHGRGMQLFERHLKAIHDLEKILRNTTDEQLKAKIRNSIAAVLQADASLAQVAIDDALVHHGDMGRIGKATSSMQEALSSFNSGHADDAAKFYAKAWHNAVQSFSDEDEDEDEE